ncbi:unnamed protein product [Pleuronectes platessa]|uniref:Uncharacterized protein n=1 Tax=Pleuronectes platessa TaxID=8262 RepID=A0A9N7U6V1_PLEPL|nr:unnamed protein product [Pleuronectes platessa]
MRPGGLISASTIGDLVSELLASSSVLTDQIIVLPRVEPPLTPVTGRTHTLLFYGGPFRVQHLAQGHFGMQMGQTGDRTADLQVELWDGGRQWSSKRCWQAEAGADEDRIDELGFCRLRRGGVDEEMTLSQEAPPSSG